MSRITPQLICFSYHKTGTSLFLHVMTKVSRRLGLRLANHYGIVNHLARDPDIVLLPHSLLRAPLDRPYRAIRLIRDPRDIWISGYLYHKRCDEGWCQNTDLDPAPPIGWPRVDYSFAHWPEPWKRQYLERMGGKSYQQNLLDRSITDGLDFELEGYTGCTLETMRQWALNRADALDVRLEDVMADFDGSMLRIFRHFGFTAGEQEAALEVARTEDVRRMNDATVAERPQIHSRTISKWRSFLSPAQIARFEARYGDLIRALGYASATVSGTERSAADSSNVLMDAPVWLSADGAMIHPTTGGRGVYGFVVPAGQQQVRLQSQCGMAADLAASPWGGWRQLGVRVNRIAIQSDAGMAVFDPDDPRLIAGWHNAEHDQAETWRWTDGSGEIPWTGVAGPAEVSISCRAFGEFPE